MLVHEVASSGLKYLKSGIYLKTFIPVLGTAVTEVGFCIYHDLCKDFVQDLYTSDIHCKIFEMGKGIDLGIDKFTNVSWEYIWPFV